MSEKDWKRCLAVISGLTCVGVAVLVAPNMFSGYGFDPVHLLSHSIYNALIVLCAILLIRGKIPEIFDRLRTLDLNTFDVFQYTLARKILSLASSITKIHTGNLNLNMLGFLVGLIMCLLFLLGFAFF